MLLLNHVYAALKHLDDKMAVKSNHTNFSHWSVLWMMEMQGCSSTLICKTKFQETSSSRQLLRNRNEALWLIRLDIWSLNIVFIEVLFFFHKFQTMEISWNTNMAIEHGLLAYLPSTTENSLLWLHVNWKRERFNSDILHTKRIESNYWDCGEKER